MLALFERVVLTRDLPDDGLQAGDVGVIVEHYPATAKVPEGVRRATERDILTVREVAGT